MIAQIRVLLFNLNEYYVIRGVTHCVLWGLTGCRGCCKEIAAVRSCRSPHVSTAYRLQVGCDSPHYPSQVTICHVKYGIVSSAGRSVICSK